jgi:hypothetical protein
MLARLKEEEVKGTNQVPSRRFASIAHLVVGGEDEEYFGRHRDTIYRLFGFWLYSGLQLSLVVEQRRAACCCGGL